MKDYVFLIADIKKEANKWRKKCSQVHKSYLQNH
jgi:hypothetical protein